MINALISHLSAKVGRGENPYESEYSRIMFAIMPYYFKYDDNYTFSPEIWNDNPANRAGRCDGMLSLTIVDPNRRDYGSSLQYVMYECKRRSTISWEKLANDQLWEQADANKNPAGRLWVIGQIGFDMCVFSFDILNYLNRNEFRNFSPLNLNNWSAEDFISLDIGCIHRVINNVDTLLVIKWKLNDTNQHQYIHNMLDYISRNNP